MTPVTSPVQEGFHSLRHVSTGNDSFTFPYVGAANAALGEIDGEETFTFSIWGRASQSSPIELFIFCLDDQFQHNTDFSSKGFTATPTWKRFEHSHTCPDGTRYVSARVDNDTSGRTVWWDAPRLVDDNLLQDGSFESASLLLPFTAAVQGSLQPVLAQTHGGDTAYVLRHQSTGNDSYTWPHRDTLEAAVAAVDGVETLRLSAWVKANVDSQVELFIFCLGSSYQNLGFGFVPFQAKTFWQEFDVTKTCPANTRHVGVRLDNNTAGRTVWWDDVRLERQ